MDFLSCWPGRGKLDDARRQLLGNIARLEVDLAELLVKTPYLWLLTLPGINVVSATELAGEMGPIEHYANANAITGRAGLFPVRSQSDEVDVTGELVRTTNRRLRAALMLVADNLVKCNHFFIGLSAKWEQNQVDPRAIRVRVAKRFTRLLFALVAGRQLLRHHCATNRESLLGKLLKFHQEHHTTSEQLLPQLEAAVAQLTQPALEQEGQLLNAALSPAHRRGPSSLADLLPLILAKYGIKVRPRSAASASRSATPVVATASATSSSPVSVSVSGTSLEVTQPSPQPVGPTASNGSNPV